MPCGATAKSVFNHKISESFPFHQQAIGLCWCLCWKRLSPRDMFWDVSWRLQLRRLNGQISGCCSKGKRHKSEMPCTCIDLDPRSQQSGSFDLREQWNIVTVPDKEACKVSEWYMKCSMMNQPGNQQNLGPRVATTVHAAVASIFIRWHNRL